MGKEDDYARPKVKRKDHAKMREFAYFQKMDLTDAYERVIDLGLTELKKSGKKNLQKG